MSAAFSNKFNSISQGSARSTPRRIPSINTVKKDPVLMKERNVPAGKYRSTIIEYFEDARFDCPGLVYRLRPILPDGSVSSAEILARNLYFDNNRQTSDLINDINRYGFPGVDWQSLVTMEEEFVIEYIPSNEYAIVRDRVYLGGGPGNIPVPSRPSGEPNNITVKAVDTDVCSQDELPFEM